MSDATATFIERYLEPASDAHYATLMAPAATRHATAAAFAFHQHIRNLLAIAADVAPSKIAWWHDALGQLREARAAHPALEPLLSHASEALIDDLNTLLHGAVMDFNRVDVDDDNLDEYLSMRVGALHAVLARIEQRPVDPASSMALARVHGVIDMVRESREPAFAEQPSAPLTLPNTSDDASMAAALTQHLETARKPAEAARYGVASHALLALRIAQWPKIVETPSGEQSPSLPPWRKLFIAWRAARRA
ncbi:MAG: hypothetical protein AB8G16_10425 [Gammaproteobacteria bacterium]